MSTVTHHTYTDTFNYASRESRHELWSPMTINLRGSSKIPPYIYRLPVEIIAYIFEIGTHWSFDPNDPLDFPVQVAAVSRHFRAVACATPSLWSTVNFYSPRPVWYDSNSDDDYEYTYTRDSIWLERSQAYPLDLVLCFRDMSWDFDEETHYFRREHMERILALVAPHSHRIRRFSLICDTFAPLHAALIFLAAHGNIMEQLETLELYRCNEYAAESPNFYPTALVGPVPLLGGYFAPRLNRVVLSGVHVDWTLSKGPLSNLDTLELAYHSRDTRPSVLDFADILGRSPNITSLGITDSGPLPPSLEDHGDNCSILQSNNFDRIRLPLLRTFKVGYHKPVDALILLHLIDASSTVDLTIKDTSRSSENETDGGSAILAFIANPTARLFPQLKILCLDTVKTTVQAFTCFLESSPGIHTLRLDHVSKEVLVVLAPPCASPLVKPLCPTLVELSLRRMPGLGPGTIAKVRDSMGMTLDKLSIYFRDEISDEELALAKDHSRVVALFGHSSEDLGEDSMDWGENEDPYAPGGVFNDPEFDAMFF